VVIETPEDSGGVRCPENQPHLEEFASRAENFSGTGRVIAPRSKDIVGHKRGLVGGIHARKTHQC
jgi:hypothetical protein